MNTSNFLLFGAYPYIAMAVLIVGSWARYDNEQYTWKAGSTQILNDKGMRIASNLFHIGVLFIIFGHFYRPADAGVPLSPCDIDAGQAVAGNGFGRVLRHPGFYRL